MKKIFSTVLFCTSFFLSGAESPRNVLPGVRTKDLGDTGAERQVSPRKTPIQSPRRNSNGVPFTPKFLDQENLRLQQGQLLPSARSNPVNFDTKS